MGSRFRVAGVLAVAGLLMCMSAGVTAESVDGEFTVANSNCSVVIEHADDVIDFGSWVWNFDAAPGGRYDPPADGSNTVEIDVSVYGPSSAPDDQCNIAMGAVDMNLVDPEEAPPGYDTTIPGTSEYFTLPAGVYNEGSQVLPVTLDRMPVFLFPGIYEGTLVLTVSEAD